MAPIASRLTVRRRPQDDVAIGVGMPTEDEFALCAMTGCSPYMEWAFPKGGVRLRKVPDVSGRHRGGGRPAGGQP